MSNETIPGGLSPYTCKISDEAKKAFEQAMIGWVGVRYSPVAVSQQVVAGMIYRFFCNSQMVTLHASTGAAIVVIYQPLDAQAYVKAIHPIE